MEKEIQKILEDIYMSDESLKKYEGELKKAIRQLIEARPDAEMDEKFMSELRTEILRRADELKGGKVKAGKEAFFSFGKLAYALGGAALVLVVVIPFLGKDGVSPLKHSQVANDGEKVSLALDEVKIAKKSDNAFGSLEQVNVEEAMNQAVPGAGGGGGIPAPRALEQGEALGLGAADMAVGTKMIMPNYTNYEYVYTGGEIPALKSSLEVFRKVKGSVAQNDLARRIAQFDLGVLDLSKFKNTNVSNLNLVEDRDFGYSIYFNLRDGVFSISTNWEKWPRPDENCRDQACFERYKLTINDVPGDEEIVAIADAFLDEYGINIENYGEGEVLDHWRRSYEQAEDKSRAWIPDSIPVVYPLILEGEPVYDEGGNKTGVTVEVNIRYKRAAGLHGIEPLNYESSGYEAETDVDVIKKVAENGGRHRRYYFEDRENAKTATIELGTPKLALVKYWQYDQEKNEGAELYVPSYIFPVVSFPDDIYYYQQSIVVPLIKDMLKEVEDGAIEPMPRPMPLLEDGDAARKPAEVPADETEVRIMEEIEN